MDDNNKKHGGQFNASLPLPQSGGTAKHDPVADLIRRRVNAAYADAPSVSEEVQEVLHPGSGAKLSRHQKFILELTESGRPMHEIQTAWYEYYSSLPDSGKHQVWREFYADQARGSQSAGQAATAQTKPIRKSRTRPVNKSKKPLPKHLETLRKVNPPQQVRSLFFGLGMGSIVLLIFLFSFFNERFIAPFIQPSRNVTNTPIISESGALSPDPEVIIPKINVEIPVVYGVNTFDDQATQNALENGVVHYADTALPGQNGNGVIVGHSSNNILNPGHYKFAFVLLSRLDSGDTFYIQKDGKRYTYQVYQKEIVKPTDVSVLEPTDKPATFSLITCDPPGTSTNRLVVIGQQISPDPSTNVVANNQSSLVAKATIIPGNSASLWSRLLGLLRH
jgi:sortase A